MLQTVLFEARDKPGGRAYVYEEQGFTFDAGPTVITAPHCLEELFTLTGRKLSDYVELLPVHPFYRLLWDDGDRFDYDDDLEGMLAQIRRRSPADVDGYLRFVEYSKAVFTEGYERLVAEPFLRFSDMVKVAPKLMGLRADRSVYGAVSKYVKDEHLRQALSFHSLLVGGNPIDTSAIYTLIHYLERKWGVFFPRGGTGALVRALAELFVELGGELRLSTPGAPHRGRDRPRRRAPALGHHGSGRARGLRPGGLQRRPAPHLREALRPRARRAAQGPEAGEDGLVDVAVRPLLRDRSSRTTSRTTRCSSVRAIAACSTTSSRAPRCPRTSASTCTRRR